MVKDLSIYTGSSSTSSMASSGTPHGILPNTGISTIDGISIGFISSPSTPSRYSGVVLKTLAISISLSCFTFREPFSIIFTADLDSYPIFFASSNWVSPNSILFLFILSPKFMYSPSFYALILQRFRHFCNIFLQLFLKKYLTISILCGTLFVNQGSRNKNQSSPTILSTIFLVKRFTASEPRKRVQYENYTERH